MPDPTYDNVARLDREGVPALDEPINDDEGMLPPADQPHAVPTAAEQARGESLEDRLGQELSEDNELWQQDVIAEVGGEGEALSAEEAAMHITDEP